LSGDLSIELGKVEKSGGKILLPKTQISEEVGYMALFSDSEGNRIALHSAK
jgi:predicted enzyme related to lactoylglutathione lyase